MAKRKQGDSTEQAAPKKLRTVTSEDNLCVGNSIVTFYVGPDKVQIPVHSKMLFEQVPVFEKMFTGGWKESASRTAELPEDDPIVFQRFVTFLYYGKIGVLSFRLGKGIGCDDWDYMRLYAFAQKYCFNNLMDYAFSRLFFYNESNDLDLERSMRVPGVDAMIFVSQNTSTNCALQRYMRKLFLRNLYWNKAYSDDELRQLSKECPEALFVIGKWVRNGGLAPDENDDKKKLCARYHMHGKEVACHVPDPKDDYLRSWNLI